MRQVILVPGRRPLTELFSLHCIIPAEKMDAKKVIFFAIRFFFWDVAHGSLFIAGEEGKEECTYI